MHIPRIWARADAEVSTPDKRTLPLVAWGWGDDDAQALQEAEIKLARLSDRVRRGDPFPGAYEYGSRPIREEILETFGDAGEPRAVLTRNRYGTTVLNAARLMFLDVDLPEGPSVSGFLGRLFGGASPEEAARAKLRETLAKLAKGAFRIYRTAAGFRALAVDREFDPAGREAGDIMTATGTDPWFVRLCLAQKSFRARLTPKPWRCGLKHPPGEFPRTDPAHQAGFAAWLAEYEEVSKGYATCRFLETAGKGGFGLAVDEELVALHDRATRATEALPLA
jgi:hypothetical protein